MTFADITNETFYLLKDAQLIWLLIYQFIDFFIYLFILLFFL